MRNLPLQQQQYQQRHTTCTNTSSGTNTLPTAATPAAHHVVTPSRPPLCHATRIITTSGNVSSHLLPHASATGSGGSGGGGDGGGDGGGGRRQLGVCKYEEGRWEPQAKAQMRYHSNYCSLLRTVGAVNCLNPKRPRSPKYLRYKWVPPTCGATFGFNAREFLNRMRNKVVASVGDSLSYENFMPSIVCQLNEVARVETADELLGKLAGRGLLVPTHIMRVRAYNITLVNVWSTFLNHYVHDDQTLRKYNGGVKPTAEDAVVDVTRLDSTWAEHVGQYDVLVLQSAAHWRAKPTKWRRYFVDSAGVRQWPEKKYTKAFFTGMKTAADFLTARKAKGASKPLSYFLSAPAAIDGCGKYRGALGQSQADAMVAKNRQAMVFLPAQLRAFRKAPVRIIQLTRSTIYRPDALVGASGNDDCVHWCLPGVPDSWTDMFYEQLRADMGF
ncbi:unnamed protein product [Closterium sp. Naga37s-1]|nr:unnamed protein product [Closterium sp. Naga37s-1]